MVSDLSMVCSFLLFKLIPRRKMKVKVDALYTG